ncbi:benzoate 4-monooxygenase cytochrome P450 [Apiospora rasikravindrae]|uniref:Benzoate 4-monooxygenase cytochrome P450 n=1 Tax=Apiospora rasikravindrae TaxID=990691 RepID=A0ABR1SZZ7_9PEZI
MMDSMSQQLHMAAQADLSTTLLTAAVVGLLSHMPIRSFEFEMAVYHFLAGCVVCFFGLGGLYFHTGQSSSLYAALARSLLVQAVFHVSLLTSIAVYRLGFHRCHNIPGPLGAKLSRFYAAYLASKKLQFHNELLQMHEKYGDFVRTGPREVSIKRKAAVYAIFGPNSKCVKSTWHAQFGLDPNKVSMMVCRDRAITRDIRPRIKSHADLLVQRLREQSGRPVNATQWSMFFSFDMIGDVGYGKSFDQLVTLEEHPAVKPIHGNMAEMAVLGLVPWLLHLLSSIPGGRQAFDATNRFCIGQRSVKQKTWSNDDYPRDIVSWLLKAMSEKDGTGPPSIEALDEDTKLLLIAGRTPSKSSETTATALTNALFFASQHPEKQEKLRAALHDSTSTDWSYEAVQSVKYLDHFINETMRLKPSVILSGRYETPPEGLQVDEVRIPGRVVVTAPLVWLHRDPRYWQRPDEFLPERWGEDRRAEMGTDGAPYFPFSLGKQAINHFHVPKSRDSIG